MAETNATKTVEVIRKTTGERWTIYRVPEAADDVAVRALFQLTWVGDPGDHTIPWDAIGDGFEWRSVAGRPKRVCSRQVVLIPHGPRSAQYAVLMNGGPWGVRWIKRWNVWSEITRLPERLGKGHDRATPLQRPSQIPSKVELEAKLNPQPRPGRTAPTRAQLAEAMELLRLKLIKRPDLTDEVAEELQGHLLRALGLVEQ